MRPIIRSTALIVSLTLLVTLGSIQSQAQPAVKSSAVVGNWNQLALATARDEKCQ